MAKQKGNTKKLSTKSAPAKRVQRKVAVKPAPRVLERPKYKTFRVSKRIKHPNEPIPGAFRLFVRSIRHMFRHKRLFFGITGVYFLLNALFVSGFFGVTDFAETKNVLQEAFTGTQGQVATGITMFSLLIKGGTGSVTETSGVYRTLLTIIMSLVIIWALRKTYAGEKATVKNAFYKSTYSLVPFVIVLIVIVLQLVPFLLGSGLYNVIISQGLAPNVIAKVLWALFVLCIGMLSLYMVSSSVFALYIVTLPDITPTKALRSARELVRYRRWAIMRKVLFFPVAVFALTALIMIPTLLYATGSANLVFLFLMMILIVLAHGYMYRLYRELL